MPMPVNAGEPFYARHAPRRLADFVQRPGPTLALA
jgi:hypothetical protein